MPVRSRLVIFGCGYVGSAVAAVALARRWQVVALTRNQSRAGELQAAGVRVIAADLANDTWHDDVSREQDFVVNCVSSGGGGLEGYQRSYVEGTKSILRWAGGGVPATFVYTGSTSVYPQNDGSVVTEDSPVGEGGSGAARPLLETESLVHESMGFRRWFILRLAGIYGPGRHFLVDQLRAGATVFPGTGTHRLNLVHRDDIVAAIFACLDSSAERPSGIFNVADDSPATKGEVAGWLAAQLGVPSPHFARDMPASTRVAAPPVRGRSGPVPDRFISNARLKTQLGWRPLFSDFRAGYESIFENERLLGSR